MRISFQKYHGTGNDFILIDDRQERFPADIPLIQKLCHRHFGIGADGLILIRNHASLDFEMIYYNADGSQSMCGNGSRCAVHFAYKLGLAGGKTKFLSTDGPHFATIENGIVAVQLHDVKSVVEKPDAFFINTGSPHHIQFVKELANYAVVDEGRKIRFSSAYAPSGTNVNFVELLDNNAIFVRTYERGVENETLSCGTGVTACSIAAYHRGYRSPVKVKTPGGELEVSFKAVDGIFQDVYLRGPACSVFEGQLAV